MRISIKNLVIITTTASVIMASVVLAGVSAFSGSRFEATVEEDMQAVTAERLSASVGAVHGVIEAEHDALTERSVRNLAVADAVLSEFGNLGTSDEMVTWDIPLEDGETRPVQLPKVTSNGAWLGKPSSYDDYMPIVTEYTEITKDTLSIFQKMNDDGDLMRVASNFPSGSNVPAVGVPVLAENATGYRAELVEGIKAGETLVSSPSMRGKVWFISCRPLVAAVDGIDGAVCAGVSEENIARMRDLLIERAIGENGFIATLVASGDNKGYVPFSGNEALEGENALEVETGDMLTFVQSVLDTGPNLGEDEVGRTKYKDPTGAEREAFYQYFEPWNWVVISDTLTSDFTGPIKDMENARSAMLRSIIIGAALMALVGGLMAWYLGSRVSKPLMILRDRMADIAEGEGDLTQRVEAHHNNEIGEVGIAFNAILDRISETVTSARNAASGVLKSVGDMVELTNVLNDSANRQAGDAMQASASSESVVASVMQTANATEQMNSAIQEISGSAARASQVGQRAADLASETESVVTKLGDSSTEISNVMSTIAGIAEQTNLLALNATIEAARAGDAGKGFAVVADEVQELARETTEATEEISARVLQIQSETQSAVERIGQIAEVVREMNEAQTTIAAAVEEQSYTTSEVSTSVNQAVKNMDQIRDALTAMNHAASQAAVFIGDVSKNTDELRHVSEVLSTDLDGFKI